ncbi:hypothetical protein PL9214650652 [Planktothrix tepida PCC 9214]|uniref:Uncharacterized protein n=1 Tax=Planktothrix tepida PCC 9214 TaxID=671072 RepID=A0A1J1LRL3_9CYAN|nr:hypothetical protein PL9214650652 [Planktothrix tepida PCC 9214]
MIQLEFYYFYKEFTNFGVFNIKPLTTIYYSVFIEKKKAQSLITQELTYENFYTEKINRNDSSQSLFCICKRSSGCCWTTP